MKWVCSSRDNGGLGPPRGHLHGHLGGRRRPPARPGAQKSPQVRHSGADPTIYLFLSQLYYIRFV